MKLKSCFLLITFYIVIYSLFRNSFLSDWSEMLQIKIANEQERTLGFYKTGLASNLSQRKFVVYSVTLEYAKDYYMFHLPLTASAWRRIGFEPVIFLVSSNHSNINSLAAKTLEYLNLFNMTIVRVSSLSQYEVIAGMLSRLFVGLAPNHLINDDDFILTTDSDLFPVDKDYYTYLNDGLIKLWSADCCGDFEHLGKRYTMIHMMHIGMTKRQWRDVMGLNSKEFKLDGESILRMVRQMYGDSYMKKNTEIRRGSPVWFMDQKTISMKLYNYVVVENKSMFTKRRFRGRRLDRSNFVLRWLQESNLHLLTDFHSFHEDVFKQWHLIKIFLAKLFDKTKCEIFDKYFSEYSEIRKKISFS